MQNDADAAPPRAQQPEAGASPKAEGRYLSIDVLRALAILLMIQVHAVDNFSENIEYSGFLYDAAQIFGYMPAPLFALLSGLSYSLWLDAQHSAARSAGEITKYSLRRGLFLFVLGFVVNVLVYLPDSTFDWDILALIGAAAIILTWAHRWRPGVVIAVCIAILLVSPLVRDAADYQSYWRSNDFDYDTNMHEVLLGFIATGYFPLLPWLVYPLLGFVVGQTFYPHGKQASLPLALPLIGGGIFLLGVLGAVLKPMAPRWLAHAYATGWPEGFYPATTVYVLISVGAILVCLWLANRVIDHRPGITGRGRVVTFFRRYSYFALTAYCVHLAVQVWPLYVYAWWRHRSHIDYYLGRAMTVAHALLSSLALIAALYLVLIVLDRHRKYSLEYFMRWIST